MRTKISYGIALCRHNKEKNNIVEILLIKKRYSYHFFSFVMGFYKPKDIKYIEYMLDNMNFCEKIDILGMDFGNMWYRIWLNNPEKHFNISDVYKYESLPDIEIYKTYHQKKTKFLANFGKDNGTQLRHYIKKSINTELIWEIPKGTKNFCESNIECAIREFHEETSISYNDYRILFHVNPIIDSFVDDNTLYKSVYYLAVLEDGKNPAIGVNFDNCDQIHEVEQVKWVSINEIQYMDLRDNIHNRLISIYSKIINAYKKYNKISTNI